MRFVYFTHSLRSCWNHGNAHFLRGVLRELLASGHDIRSYEPEAGWSVTNLLAEPTGPAAFGAFARDFADLSPNIQMLRPDLDAMLDGADVVLVHEWNDPLLVAAIGKHRRRAGRYLLLFHDTHHRAVTDPAAMDALDLDGYDAVLAFGESLACVYRAAGWGSRVFVWHEAADTRLFRPVASETERNGAVWIGNWGDNERSAELHAYLLDPVRSLNLPLDIYGVRYPRPALDDIAAIDARYRGWLPNARVPEVFSRHLMTVHVPRHAYASQLPGIPTIRVFEAMACGIPLICAPWTDTEYLFHSGTDYLVARTSAEMQAHMAHLRADASARGTLTANGLETIRARHTCAHRVKELLGIVRDLGMAA